MSVQPHDILGSEGRLAQRMANYELRPQQLEMADAVAEAMRDERHLIVEAGTGTGKSLAYLVPAILAVTSGDDRRPSARRIVVSTHTISLQQQLISQDLPLLNSVNRSDSGVLTKFAKKTPASGIPNTATIRKVIAPTLSQVDAALIENVSSPALLPSASMINTNAHAAMTPPAKPPPGVKCPYRTTWIP